MYVAMKTILEDANKNNYAVVAANAINFELIRGIIDAAVEANAPIVINIGPGQLAKRGDAEIFTNIIKTLATRTHIPVAFNYDHGRDYRGATEVFRAGFSSIMIDASEYPLEENIARTKEIVKLGNPNQVTVEAELGHVGQAVSGDGTQIDLYTNPDDATYFVKQTGIDALAVTVGTAHGKYPAGFEPKLDFDRLSLLKEKLKMPLVLHGTISV
jgi:fructose-bisphosphate aldolase class II